LTPVVPLDRAAVFFDGGRTPVRLRHAECVAIDAAGDVWCGGESGEIYRIDRDGAALELVASNNGATLGIAFDEAGYLYVCDAFVGAVDRLDPRSGELRRFARVDPGAIRIPNFPVVDTRRGCLYVSDSHSFDEAGPGIWRFDLETGEGGLWYSDPLRFANGMALSADGTTLYVAETFARRVIAIEIDDRGRPGEKRVVVDRVERLPDGLALDAVGNLLVTCYEPSRIYRLDTDGNFDLLLDDPDAHMLCHPTNCAFRGNELFIANLGRCHITRVMLNVGGLPLPVPAAA
jgi:sugar lactone lactonase YvrE